MRLEWVALLQIFKKLPGIDMKHTWWATCSSWRWIIVDREGVKKQNKSKWKWEEIEKALLTYWSRRQSLEPQKGNKPWSTIPHMGRPCKQGWFLCTTPANCCHPISDDSRAQELHQTYWMGIKKIIIIHLHYHLQKKKKVKLVKLLWTVTAEDDRSFSVQHSGASNRTMRKDQVQ